MENIVLVTTGNDSARLPEPFRRRLCFSHCFSNAGALRRRVAMLEPERSILGVSDLVALESCRSPDRLCEDLVAEVQALGCPGVFLDIEQNYGLLREFLQSADERLWTEGIPLYVPERCAGGMKHAVAVCEAAVSGGSFDRLFEDLLEQYGENRVAAMLQPICTGFQLPSQDADGFELTLAELEHLRAQHGAQVYFSKELCAKYFTFMDENGKGHFILFDDPSTMREKYRRLKIMGAAPCFVLSQDARLLLSDDNPAS